MKWVNASSCVKLVNVNHGSIDCRANHCFRDSANVNVDTKKHIQQLKEVFYVQAFRVDKKFESTSAFDCNLDLFIFVLSTMFPKVILDFNP